MAIDRRKSLGYAALAAVTGLYRPTKIAAAQRSVDEIASEVKKDSESIRGAFPHVNMHVDLLIKILLETEHLCATAHHGHGCLNRLLHDLAQLTGMREF